MSEFELKGTVFNAKVPKLRSSPKSGFLSLKASNHLQGQLPGQRELGKITENPLIVCSYWFDPNMILKVGQHHKCQINFPNYFFVIDLIILVKFFFLKRTNGRKSCWKRTIGADLEFVKKFTGPNFRVKEFYALKTRKSRLFSPALNSENASLSVIWPSFG